VSLGRELPPPRPNEPIFGRSATQVFWIVVLGLFLLFAGQLYLNQAKDPPWQPPEGFTSVEVDSRSAYRFATTAEAECSMFSPKCVAIDVVAQRGCSDGMRATVTFLDRGGRNIGTDFEIVEHLKPGEIGHLVFTLVDAAANDARVESLECRN
jgi:hypothetical protein